MGVAVGTATGGAGAEPVEAKVPDGGQAQFVGDRTQCRYAPPPANLVYLATDIQNIRGPAKSSHA